MEVSLYIHAANFRWVQRLGTHGMSRTGHFPLQRKIIKNYISLKFNKCYS